MSAARRSLFGELWLDATLILARQSLPVTLRNVVWLLFACDGMILLAMFRTRRWLRRHRIPLLGRLLRGLETALFAAELSSDADLEPGVFFMHTVGIVIGSGCRIGGGCVFLGNNTVGASERGGAPRVGARTVIGAGVRVLGDIEIGEDCVLGANAVVVSNVPAGKVAVGIPARVTGDNPRQQPAPELASSA